LRSLSPRNSRTRKVASMAPEDIDDSWWWSERSTRGVGGHVAQLKKAGEILMAPARQRKGRGAVEISDSEVNPMAPSQQLKKGKKKVSDSFQSSSTNILLGWYEFPASSCWRRWLTIKHSTS
jgi:hypothetical protein